MTKQAPVIGLACPYYAQCPHKLGDAPQEGVECSSEGFIDCDDGMLCLAWDVVLEYDLVER